MNEARWNELVRFNCGEFATHLFLPQLISLNQLISRDLLQTVEVGNTSCCLESNIRRIQILVCARDAYYM